MTNPADVLTPEARILAVAQKLFIAKADVEKQIKAAYDSEGRQGVESMARRLEGRYRKLCAQLDRSLEDRWKDKLVEKAEENYVAYRSHGDLERRRERDGKTLGQRLDEALICLERQSEVSAAKVGRESRSAEKNAGPSLREEIELDTFRRRALLLVRAAESAGDRIGLRAVNTEETTEEKNTRLIRDYEGVPSWEVVAFDATMGTHPGSVERIRREHGRRGKDGRMDMREAA